MTDFKAKMQQIRFRLGLCPRPRLQRPDSLAGFGGRFAAGGRGWAGEEKEGGSGGEGMGGPPSYCWTRAPQSLATPLMALFVRFRLEQQWTSSLVSKNAPTLASCSFDKHRQILIIFSKRYQHTFKTDVPRVYRKTSDRSPRLLSVQVS